MLWNTHACNAVRRWAAPVAIATLIASGSAFAQSEQQELVNASETTFANFMRDPDMTWLQRNIVRAKGVLIAPTVVKAGVILGGSGGRAVLYSRNDQGDRLAAELGRASARQRTSMAQ